MNKYSYICVTERIIDHLSCYWICNAYYVWALLLYEWMYYEEKFQERKYFFLSNLNTTPIEWTRCFIHSFDPIPFNLGQLIVIDCLYVHFRSNFITCISYDNTRLRTFAFIAIVLHWGHLRQFFLIKTTTFIGWMNSMNEILFQYHFVTNFILSSMFLAHSQFNKFHVLNISKYEIF